MKNLIQVCNIAMKSFGWRMFTLNSLIINEGSTFFEKYIL